jgi:hypothetical protein
LKLIVTSAFVLDAVIPSLLGISNEVGNRLSEVKTLVLELVLALEFVFF